MATLVEVVRSEDFFRVIDRQGLTNSELARMIDRNERRIREMRQQATIRFEIADRILTILGLNYLLSTGDIPTEFRPHGFLKETATEAQKKSRQAIYGPRLTKET